MKPYTKKYISITDAGKPSGSKGGTSVDIGGPSANELSAKAYTAVKVSYIIAALLFVVLLSSPLLAVEILMTRSGFDNWRIEKFMPREQKLDQIEARADVLENRLAAWEYDNLSRIYLWPDDSRVEFFAPGGVHDGTGNLDAPPRIVEGRTMVPLRFVGEALGAEVIWNGDTQQVAYIAGSRQILLTVGHTDVFVNGRPEVIDTAPRIINDRTMVPVRFIGQWLGAVVRWDDAQRRVDIGWLKHGIG
ncbi:MAG: copper amine oxidase N-terminal domain-containing protein [Peptococcaceae bacterium]|jgi:hypothetical protein|nr:copper amine oxidase N-terminal domain-containing protein [Peptococcaceae bacterium]